MAQLDQFLYTRGATGRGVVVDASGRLIANSDLGEGAFIYSFGDTGRPLAVDSSGRLLINLVGGGGAGDVTDASNVGTGSGVFLSKDGSILQFKSLIPAGNITINEVQGGSGLEISTSASVGEANTASNIGASGIGVFSTKSGVDLQFRNVASGSSKILVTQNGDVILVDADEGAFLLDNIGGTLSITKGGTAATSAADARINLGLAIGIDVQAHDDNLDEIAALIPLSGALIVGDGSTWTTESGYIKGGLNVGAGSGVFRLESLDGNLEFKTLVPGTNIGINESPTELEIFSTAAGGGEANTGTNVGIGSGEVFAQKSGTELQFRRLLQGSGIQIETSGNTVRLDWTHLDDFNILDGDVTQLRTDFDNSSGVFQDGTNTADQVRIDFDNSSGIFVKDGENLGAGEGIFAQKDVDQNLEFKTLIGGSGISLESDANTVTVNRDSLVESLPTFGADTDMSLVRVNGVPGLAFVPGGTRFIQWNRSISKEFRGGLASGIALHMKWVGRTANTGVVRWRFRVSPLKDNTLLTDLGHVVQINDISATYVANELRDDTFAILAASGLQNDDYVIRIERLGGDAADTYGGFADLYSASIEYIAI